MPRIRIRRTKTAHLPMLQTAIVHHNAIVASLLDRSV
jgi:hypothetical protein